MNLNSIRIAVNMILTLINETEWGRKTTCKEMLCLVYEECRELRIGLSNSDISNILEETSDVNMMLIYFCCKLSEKNVECIEELFLKSASYADYLAEQTKTYNVEEIYREILMSYGCLINLYEAKEKKIFNIYNKVREISSSVLFLARVKNNGNSDTVDTVFESISQKLRRRYALYFDKRKMAGNCEEDVWKVEKAVEKDMPYIYCKNRVCESYGRLGGKNILFIEEQIFCRVCGNKIQKNDILLPKSKGKERRKAIETMERSLVSYNKGDNVIIALYVFHHVDECINIFSDLILNGMPLDKFILYFSEKCAVPEDIAKRFLCNCFYRTFVCGDMDGKQELRTRAVRYYVTKKPTEFIHLAVELGLGKAELRKILYTAILFLKKNYNTDNVWNYYNGRIMVDMQKKSHAVFWILSVLYELDTLDKEVLVVRFVNCSKNQQICKYRVLVDYFFVNEEHGIQRIVFENEDGER